MTEADDRGEQVAHALDRFWDQVVAGESVAPADVDADLAAVVRALDTRRSRVTPEPVFVARLEDRLIHAGGGAAAPHPPFGLPWPPNGRALLADTVGQAVPRPVAPRQRVLAHLVTAALVVLMLASAYIAIVQTHPERGLMQRLQATREPATLFATTLPPLVAPSEAVRDFAVWHATIDPGGHVVKSPEFGDCCPAPVFYHVLAGELVVRVDAPSQVARAGGHEASATPEAVAPGTEILLRPGNTALWPFDSAVELTNPGGSPVRFLAGGYFPGTLPEAPAGYTIDNVGETYPAPVLPTGPVRLMLQRTTLEPNAGLDAPPSGVLREVVGESALLRLVERSDGSIRNVGQEAAVVYLLTLEPTGGQASALMATNSSP